MGSLHGEHNPAWKGGRTVAPHGYVLVRRTGHHLADVRGYVYEHRLVAEQKIGRRLRKGEQVHHIDGDRQNNHPDNLHVCANKGEHVEAEGKHNPLTRRPGEANPYIACACGCGKKFRKYDLQGRPRRYFKSEHVTARNEENGQWARIPG